MTKLKIDPEFRDKIPPMTDEQFNGLRDDILRDGYVRDPLVVWEEENTLLDGHHRWKIICENWEELKDKYTIVYMSFPNRWAAMEWICRNQLNKHNLNDEQVTYITGEMYKARKKSVGNHAERGANGKYLAGKNYRQGDCLSEEDRALQIQEEYAKRREIKDGVAGIIARELDIGERTVRNAEKFHDGVDALREVSPEAADKVMRGRSGVLKKDIIDLLKKSSEEKESFAADVLSGAAKKKTVSHLKPTKRDKEALVKTEKIIADMYNADSVPDYTIEFLLEDIQINGEKYVSLLRNTLKDRNALLTEETRPVVANAIDRIINRIISVKELVST